MFVHEGSIYLSPQLAPSAVPDRAVVGTRVALPTNTVLLAVLDCAEPRLEVHVSFIVRPSGKLVQLSTEVAGAPRVELAYDGAELTVARACFVHLCPSDPGRLVLRVRIISRASVFELAAGHEALCAQVDELAGRLDEMYFMPGAPGYERARDAWREKCNK